MSIKHLPILSIALLCVLAGCRTYGGRDSEEITFRQIETAVQNNERAYERAKANAATLARSARRNPAMAPLADKYEALVAVHRARLTDQRERMEDLRGSGNYRTLSRALGGVVKDQQVMTKRYRGLIARYRPGADTMAVAFEVPPRSRYQLVPPFYEAERNRSQPRLPGLAHGEQEMAANNGDVADTMRSVRVSRRDTMQQ